MASCTSTCSRAAITGSSTVSPITGVPVDRHCAIARAKVPSSSVAAPVTTRDSVSAAGPNDDRTTPSAEMMQPEAEGSRPPARVGSGSGASSPAMAVTVRLRFSTTQTYLVLVVTVSPISDQLETPRPLRPGDQNGGSISLLVGPSTPQCQLSRILVSCRSGAKKLNDPGGVFSLSAPTGMRHCSYQPSEPSTPEWSSTAPPTQRRPSAVCWRPYTTTPPSCSSP